MMAATRNATPPVSALYGAPMGRHAGPAPITANGDKWTLRHIPLDAGGYDPGGAYWGRGQRLYWARNEAGGESFFRAVNRDAAKRRVVEEYDPAARFYDGAAKS
jgi:hypothetical protein